jgi:hypothetical protein
MMTKTVLRAALLLVLAGPGLAQDAAPAPGRLFSLPANCTAYLTVQSRACSVTHHFTCTDDPAGQQRRVDLDEQGMTYMGTIDAQTQWVASYHPLSGHYENLEPGPADPANFDELLANGVDTYDFRTLSEEIGITRYVGKDRLTGVTEVIDGVTLDQTEYSITAFAADGSEVWRAGGQEYISRDWRMFLSGVGTTRTPTESFETDDRPVEFIFPGEPGFLSADPKHGCGMVVSDAAPGLNPLALQEPDHDHL